MLKWKLVQLKPAAHFFPQEGDGHSAGTFFAGWLCRVAQLMGDHRDDHWVLVGARGLGGLSLHHVHPHFGQLETCRGEGG